MEPNRLRRKASKFFGDFALARLQCFQFGLDARALQSTGSEGIEEGINAALQVLSFTLETVAPVTAVTPGSVDLVVEGADELADKIGRHELMSESFDNPSLDFASTNTCAIGAGSLPSGSGAGDVILADWCGRPAANAANCFPGQEMMGATAGPEFRCASFGYRVAIPDGAEPRLYAVPEIVV